MNFVGARVVIACRNLDKGRQAIENLINETECNKQQIRLMECDLCSFDSVRNFAELYNNEEERLDILICNAGLGYSSNEITKDGFNCVIQANYLGHFLLTNLLLNKLKESKPSRILNISSDLHKSLFNYSQINNYFFINLGVKSIDWSDAFLQHKKSRLMGAYPPSKLFQILSTYKLKHDLFGTISIDKIFSLSKMIFELR
jgi:NAD(P)-dependent dehydrogenase (short-subunit alcohol dehydrogenase family)